YALVTLERSGVLDAFVTKVKSSGEGIELPIAEAHAPNVYASVALVRGRIGSGDRNRPRFKMGLVDLAVSTQSQRLKVEVSTERKEYQPREKVIGKIMVTDAA